MVPYKVTVCQFGHAIVMAESEEDAKRKVSDFNPEQITWHTQGENAAGFLVTYAEMEEV